MNDAVRVEESVPWWGVASATAAPVLLIGGWTLAASLQPDGYDAVTQTISALAGHDAADAVVMTAALVGVGASHLTTAAALRPASTAGRIVLGLGGLATLAVAALPLPATGSLPAHTGAATVAFGALSVWPAFATRRRSPRPRVLSPAVTGPATASLVALTGWILAPGSMLGAVERAAAGAQAIWPLVTVLALRGARRRRT